MELNFDDFFGQYSRSEHFDAEDYWIENKDIIVLPFRAKGVSFPELLTNANGETYKEIFHACVEYGKNSFYLRIRKKDEKVGYELYEEKELISPNMHYKRILFTFDLQDVLNKVLYG